MAIGDKIIEGDFMYEEGLNPTDQTKYANPYHPTIILAKDSSSNQDVGGSNGTVSFWTWDTVRRADTGYAYSPGSGVVTVLKAGWYMIKFIGNVQTEGSAGTTIQGVFRLSDGVTNQGGTIKSYTRGAAYGNATPALEYPIFLDANETVEVGTMIEDSDAVYVINTSGSEIADESHLFMITQMANSV